eukprot:5564670-Amphidinium_carterae.1
MLRLYEFNADTLLPSFMRFAVKSGTLKRRRTLTYKSKIKLKPLTYLKSTRRSLSTAYLSCSLCTEMPGSSTVAVASVCERIEVSEHI